MQMLRIITQGNKKEIYIYICYVQVEILYKLQLVQIFLYKLQHVQTACTSCNFHSCGNLIIFNNISLQELHHIYLFCNKGINKTDSSRMTKPHVNIKTVQYM